MLDEELQKELIEKGRGFMRYVEPEAWESFESDQQLKKPQPPLVKAPMRAESLSLPRDFEHLPLKTDFLKILTARKSSRVYTEEGLSLLELSFLLWATQGIKAIRGKSYATLRTVPSGGARHGFETYLLVCKVGTLLPGAYHYLPMSHSLEFLGEMADQEAKIKASLQGQSWAARSAVVFYWSAVPYRFEWRYGIYAHRPAMIDLGHVGENLYLGCAALSLGTCGIAAFDLTCCDALFGLDGTDEFIVYTAPVGRVAENNHQAEQAFYQFVEDEGL